LSRFLSDACSDGTAIGASRIGSQGSWLRPLTRLSLKATEPSGAMRAVKALVS